MNATRNEPGLLTAPHRRNLEKLSRAIEVFRKTDRDMAVNLMQTFLHIAVAELHNEPTTAKALETTMNLSDAGVINNLARLGPDPIPRGGAPLGLVVRSQDVEDRRRKPLLLTDHGRALAERLAFAMQSRSAQDGAE